MFLHFNFQRRRQIEQKKIEEEEEEIRQFGQAKKVTVVNLILYTQTVDITRKISSILNGREWQVNPTINFFPYCTILLTHTCLLGFSFICGLNKAD